MYLCRDLLRTNFSTQALLSFVRFRSKTSLYNGVGWNVSWQKWRARVRHGGRRIHLGGFSDEVAAAKAYDAALREIGFEKEARLRRLNFPTQSELKTFTRQHTPDPYKFQSHAKEAFAINLIRTHFLGVGETKFAVHRLGEGTYADIVIKRRSSPNDDWFAAQVKSTWERCGGVYRFATHGNQYNGMLVICIAIVDRLLWVLPTGAHCLPKSIAITPGGKWDRYRCTDLEASLAVAWAQPEKYARFPLEAWEIPRSPLQKVERRSQTIGEKIFAAAGLPVRRPEILNGSVDMLVNGTRVQDKTVIRGQASSKYMVSMRKGKSKFYDALDFDVLVVYVWTHDTLRGMFVFPISELASRQIVSNGLSSTGKLCMYVHPPWKEYRQRSAKYRNDWQLKYYIDLDHEDINSGSISEEACFALRRYLHDNMSF